MFSMINNFENPSFTNQHNKSLLLKKQESVFCVSYLIEAEGMHVDCEL